MRRTASFLAATVLMVAAVPLPRPATAAPPAPGAERLRLSAERRFGSLDDQLPRAFGDVDAPAEISPCGRYAADGRSVTGGSGANDRTVAVIFGFDPVEVVFRGETPGRVDAIAFSPDCRRVVFGGDGFLEAVDTATWSVAWIARASLSALTRDDLHIAVSRDERTVYVGAGLFALHAFDLRSGASLWEQQAGSANTMTSLAVGAGGTILATGTDGGSIQLWDARTGSLLRRVHLPGTFAAHHGRIDGLTFAAGDRELVSGGGDGSVRFWTPQDGALQAVVRCRDGVTSLFAEPDDTKIVAACGRRVWLMDAPSERRLRELPENDDLIAEAAPLGSGLVWCRHLDSTISVWDLARETETRAWGEVAAAVLTGDGRRLAIVRWGDATADLLDPSSLSTRAHLTQSIAPLLLRDQGAHKARFVAADAAGRYVAGGGYTTQGYADHSGVADGMLTLWKIGIADPRARFPGVAPEAAAISSDGARILARSPSLSDTPDTIWSISNGTVRAATWPERRTVSGTCGSSFGDALPFIDGRGRALLALRVDRCSGEAGPPLGIAIFDPRTRRPLRRLAASAGATDGPELSQDGRAMFACTQRAMRVWTTNDGRLVSTSPAPREGCEHGALLGRAFATLAEAGPPDHRTSTVSLYDVTHMRVVARRAGFAVFDDRGDTGFPKIFLSRSGRRIDVVTPDRVDAFTTFR